MKQRIGRSGTLAEYTARVSRVIDALERDVIALREIWGDEPKHRRDYPEHGHCSICGRCGKKSSTHRGSYPGHYHTGERIAAGKGC